MLQSPCLDYRKGLRDTSPILEERRKKRFLSAKIKLVFGEENMGIKAIYEEGILKPLEKIVLEEKEEIWIEIKKRRMKGILKVDPKIVDEIIENEELFE